MAEDCMNTLKCVEVEVGLHASVAQKIVAPEHLEILPGAILFTKRQVQI